MLFYNQKSHPHPSKPRILLPKPNNPPEFRNSIPDRVNNNLSNSLSLSLSFSSSFWHIRFLTPHSRQHIITRRQRHKECERRQPYTQSEIRSYLREIRISRRIVDRSWGLYRTCSEMAEPKIVVYYHQSYCLSLVFCPNLRMGKGEGEHTARNEK